MDWIELIIGMVTGIILGFVAAFVLKLVHLKTAKELIQEHETQKEESISAIIDTVMKLGKEKLESEREINTKELETKKGLIDQQLHNMKSELEKVSDLVKNFEKDREQKFGKLSKQMEQAGKQTNELIKTTNTLREALASSKVRGQWGERMAEDVLRVAGFIENINYVKQKAIDGIGSKPDFTFFLPRDLTLNMDVKFPYDNYIKFLESESDTDRENYKKTFLKDVKSRIQEVTSREYINPEQNTVDYVLLFIPNEQIYSFIHEQDESLLDESMKKKVIICSPITLFAILAVIRQAVDNFTFEKTSHEILSLLGSFKHQWNKFIESHNKLGKFITSAVDEYNYLKSTRRNQLEKPLNKIEDIRKQRGIPIEEADMLPEMTESDEED